MTGISEELKCCKNLIIGADELIKAVIFDIDGVLLDSYEANFDFFQKLMEKAGYPGKPTEEEFRKAFHLNMKEAIRLFSSSFDEIEINRIWEMGRKREVSYDSELLKMPAGCEGILSQLKKKYQLAIVTSRIKNSIYESRQMRELESLFEVEVSCEDTKNHKPHPDPLLLATKKLGVNPEECVYVGDMESDIMAARSANMKIILFSKIKIDGADAETFEFSELPKIIESL